MLPSWRSPLSTCFPVDLATSLMLQGVNCRACVQTRAGLPSSQNLGVAPLFALQKLRTGGAR